MRALERITAILEFVANSSDEVSINSVANATGLSISTASRIVNDLAFEGFLKKNEKAGTYQLGYKFITLAKRVNSRSYLIESAAPVMNSLRDRVQETVSLHVRIGDLRTCVAQAQSRLPVRRVVQIGLSVSLHLGATGHVLLSGMKNEEIINYCTNVNINSKELDDLQQDIEKIRDQGWAMAVDSWEIGVAGIAVPVWKNDMVAAALTISGPSTRYTKPQMIQGLDHLTYAAEQISPYLL